MEEGGIEGHGQGRGEQNGVSEVKNEWCRWRVGCLGEMYEWRTKVIEIRRIHSRTTHVAKEKKEIA